MDALKRRFGTGRFPVECMPEQNPMQNLLRRHLGVDSFALDGDDTDLGESWFDKPRRREQMVQK